MVVPRLDKRASNDGIIHWRLAYRLFGYLSSKRRWQLGFLFILMLADSIAEMVSISAILPFLGILTTPEKIYSYGLIQPIIHSFQINSPSELILPITLSFIVVTLAASATRIAVLYFTTRHSFSAGADISLEIYRRTLLQPYQVHVSRNSSELINGITAKTNAVIYAFYMPALTLISSFFTLTAIFAVLIFIDPRVAAAAIFGFGAVYLIIYSAAKKQLAKSSKVSAQESTKIVKSLQEGLGGIRDILLEGNQKTYCSLYQQADLPLRKSQGDIHIISGTPKFVIEGLGMVAMASAAYYFSLASGTAFVSSLPILGGFALGAQRLLPVMQHAYSSVSNIKGAEASVNDILTLLGQEVREIPRAEANQVLNFDRKICLDKLEFRYTEGQPNVLRGLSLNIPKGAKVGFIGETGCGKSTLLDIIMGLLEPRSGVISVDGRKITANNLRQWQDKISHVSQTVYLSDATILENIAFGVAIQDINEEKVKRAVAMAELSDVIEKWPEGYKTKVGERGVKLSGGQRQRIGLARALYKSAELIVLDEATSALDRKTESRVMNSIQSVGDDITVLMIAHRLNSLSNCDFIVELENGGVKSIKSPKQLLSREEEFV